MVNEPRTVTKTIAQVKRHGMNSASGNPHYRVVFSDGTSALTKQDAAINYGVSNSDLRGVPVEVTFEGDRIVNVERSG